MSKKVNIVLVNFIPSLIRCFLLSFVSPNLFFESITVFILFSIMFKASLFSLSTSKTNIEESIKFLSILFNFSDILFISVTIFKLDFNLLFNIVSFLIDSKAFLVKEENIATELIK